MRIIKKYDNRCLYDTELSTNISIQDLKRYVLDGTKFTVINAKTAKDITRLYLIQIVLELEVLGKTLFSQESLEQIIRFYASPQQEWLQQYLEQTLTVMSKQQAMFADMWIKNQK